MLESLQHTNIGDLNLTEPRSESDMSFDPEANMTPENWEDIKKWLVLGAIDDQIEDLWLIKLISPDKLEEFDVDIDYMFEDAFSSAFSRLRLANNADINAARRDFTRTAISYLAPAIILLPEKKQETGEFLNEVYKEVISDLLSKDLVDLGNPLTTEEYFHCAIVLPESALPVIRSYQPVKDFLVTRVLQQSQDYKSTYDGNDGPLFPLNAAATRLLFPDKMSGVYKENYHLFKEGLEHFRTVGNWSSFLKLAWSMQVLSAQSVEILEDGTIKIIPKSQESFAQGTPALPEVRKF